MKFNFSRASIPFLISLLFACDSNRWDVEVEQITIDQPVVRFEQSLFEKAAETITLEETEALQRDFPIFYPLYVENIMNLGRAGDSIVIQRLNQFVGHKDIKELFEEVEKQYPASSLNKEWEQLHDGFKRFHFYFPNKIVPKIVTMISAFSYAAAADDSLLAIGLDTYLGKDYPVYAQVGIPEYKFKNFEREYIVSDAMEAWLVTEFEEEGGKNLLEEMIFQGKMAYLTEAFLPKTQPHLLFNYDQEDLKWCQENESGVWGHFVDMELLFTSEIHHIRKYMGDAPFIAGFPEGSPGRVGEWIGYRIVKSYMDNNKAIKLSDLMNQLDANQILQESNYKPKR